MCTAQSSSAETKSFGAFILPPPGGDQEVSSCKEDSEQPGGRLKSCGPCTGEDRRADCLLAAHMHYAERTGGGGRGGES